LPDLQFVRPELSAGPLRGPSLDGFQEGIERLCADWSEDASFDKSLGGMESQLVQEVEEVLGGLHIRLHSMGSWIEVDVHVLLDKADIIIHKKRRERERSFRPQTDKHNQ